MGTILRSTRFPPLPVILTLLIFSHEMRASRGSGIPPVLSELLALCDGGVFPAPSCAYTPSVTRVRTLLGDAQSHESCAGLVISISVIVALLLVVFLLYYVLFRKDTSKDEHEEYYDQVHDRMQRTRALREKVEDRAARTIQKAWKKHAASPTRPTADGGRRYVHHPHTFGAATVS